MDLSIRLQTVADLVSKGKNIADVGCDHGFVSIYLAKKHPDAHVYAMDVGSGPLSRAVAHVREEGLENRITCLQSDGLQKLEPGQVDTVIIAGMGGILMKNILEASPKVVSKLSQLVLSPHRDIPLVRSYIGSVGFSIEEERMVYEEGKYYVVISAKNRGHKVTYTARELHYGPVLLKEQPGIWQDYLRKKIEKHGDLIRLLSHEGQGDASRKKVSRLQKTSKEMEEILQEVRQND